MRVLYLYEITLLSNVPSSQTGGTLVLYLYEITLLSNTFDGFGKPSEVLYLYEITLLSNLKSQILLPYLRQNADKNGYGPSAAEFAPCNSIILF